ncbi:MAG: hypothetical protein ACKO5K_03255 [Armatimonadota bacterium]
MIVVRADTVKVRFDGLRGPVRIPTGPESAGVVGGVRPDIEWPRELPPPVAPPRVLDRVFDAWKVGNRVVARESSLTRWPRIGRRDVLVAAYRVDPPVSGRFEPSFPSGETVVWETLPLRWSLVGRIDDTVAAAVREGLRRWSDATGGAVGMEEVRGGDRPVVRVGFAPLGTSPSGRTTVSAERYGNGPFRLVRAEIQLSTDLLEGDPAKVFPGVAAVASHEAGHALGMRGGGGGGHSLDAFDTMHPTVRASIVWPSARDLNTLAELYPGRFGAAPRATGARSRGRFPDAIV